MAAVVTVCASLLSISMVVILMLWINRDQRQAIDASKRRFDAAMSARDEDEK